MVNPYTYAHDTKGKTMWEHIAKDPERASTFNYAMAAQTQASLPTVGIYPFESELGKLVEDENTVVLVDVGGGKGQASHMIRQNYPGLKGKMILQDRPEVIADITDELPGIERMPHDFFLEQPVKGKYHALPLSTPSEPPVRQSSVTLQLLGLTEFSCRSAGLLYPPLFPRLG